MEEHMQQIQVTAVGVVTGPGERVVKVSGSASHLLDGDPDQENPRYNGHALPVLLHEGWRIKMGIPFSGGVYLVLEGLASPVPRPAPTTT